MRPQLNHTVVGAHDKMESATFLAEILDLDPPQEFGPFAMVETGNGVSIDFADADEIHPIHLAFQVTERQFDEIFERLTDRDLEIWADPRQSEAGRINTNDGGRGCYFLDPAGNFLEILTRPYGSGPIGTAS